MPLVRASWRDLVRLLLVAVPLFFFGQWLEDTAFGRQVRIGAYELMQQRLQLASKPERLQVIVVGIDAIKPVMMDDGLSAPKSVTPRADILRLLQGIAHHQPKAIGVDIDFSPEADTDNFVTPGDRQFFKEVMKLEANTGVHIFFGVYRNSGDRATWLGSPDFAPLAASIVVPDAEGVAVRTMPSYLHAEATCNKATPPSCDELSSLASAMVVDLPADQAHRKHSYWIERYRNVTREGLGAEDFLVDFGAAGRLLQEARPSSGVTTAADQTPQFAGRYVLLGDIADEPSADAFKVPGYERSVRGVFIHASAIYTLLQAPLLQLTPPGEVAADIALTLLSFLVVLALRFLIVPHLNEQLAEERVEAAIALLVVGLLLYVGYYGVHELRLVWFNYALVIVLQLLHLMLERALYRRHDGQGVRRMPAWRRWLFETREGGGV
jgi:CHASE2 domain-containing sensor protein